MASIQRETDGARVRWVSRSDRAGREQHTAIMYPAARKRRLSVSARVPNVARESSLGPYEFSYDISRGYGLERTIVQP